MNSAPGNCAFTAFNGAEAARNFPGMVGNHTISLCKTALVAPTVGTELRARLVRGLIFNDAASDDSHNSAGATSALRSAGEKSPEMNLGVYIDDIAAADGG